MVKNISTNEPFNIAKDFAGPHALSQLQKYRQFLQQFNKSFNLYSRAKGCSLDVLLIDSLVGAVNLKKQMQSSSPVLDLGSGNGLPGIICAILYPQTNFILCERSLKKTEFLRYCIFHLNCLNATAICQDAALLNKQFTRILSKETASIKIVLQILKKILSPKGQAFLWKTPEWSSQWPQKTAFLPEVIQTYEIKKRKRVLLKIQR